MKKEEKQEDDDDASFAARPCLASLLISQHLSSRTCLSCASEIFVVTPPLADHDVFYC
jgi:hypothetical protein